MLIVIAPWRVPVTIRDLFYPDESNKFDRTDLMSPGIFVPPKQLSNGLRDYLLFLVLLPGLVVSVHRLRGLSLRLHGMTLEDFWTLDFHDAVRDEYRDCCYPWSYSSYEAARNV